jgi:hypothetical protein
LRYIFLQFYLTSYGAGAARKKNTRSRRRSRLVKKSGAGAAWEKKSGAGAAKKCAGSPALVQWIIHFGILIFIESDDNSVRVRLRTRRGGTVALSQVVQVCTVQCTMYCVSTYTLSVLSRKIRSRSRSRLKKKSGAGAAKFAAPQPWPSLHTYIAISYFHIYNWLIWLYHRIDRFYSYSLGSTYTGHPKNTSASGYRA